MRIYNGKPLVNSVNGDDESMEAIFPLIKKYGGVVIALTLDKNGIPNSANERVEIANKILSKAKEYGVDKKDIIFDPLALTIATDIRNIDITLEAIQLLKEQGLRTSLGISNISYGMPNRDEINAQFFAAAIFNGLSCAIVNPSSSSIQNVYNLRHDIIDGNLSIDYFISQNIDIVSEQPSTGLAKYTLSELIIKGIDEKALSLTSEYLSTKTTLQIINEDIIPALNFVGDEFENKRIYLPQLLRSAECSSKVFEMLKNNMPTSQSIGKTIILATVKGDIHDIGKNIVKLLLQSHGFDVVDLGKNVPSSDVLEAVKKYNCKLVGLSALMTTTLPSMEETIKVLHEYDSNIKIMVGGAVLTQEYADQIKADAYAKDAMAAVKCMQQLNK